MVGMFDIEIGYRHSNFAILVGTTGKTTIMTIGTFSLLLLVTTMYFHNFLLLLVTNFDRLWARPRLGVMLRCPSKSADSATGERQPVAKEEQKPSSRDVLRARARDMEECRKVRSSGGLLGDSCIVVFVQNLVLHYAREAEHALMH